MGLNLRKRETPLVKFRRELPAWLADGEPCFIEVDARPGGPINPEFVARMEQVVMRGQILNRRLGREEDDRAYVEADRNGRREMGAEVIAATYDACVIEWRSNIVDGDAPIICDRERFLGLAEITGVPEIKAAITDFNAAVMDAGKVVTEEDAKTEKN